MLMLCSESSSLFDDDQQSTVRLLADARRMAYIKGRWVYTDTGCEQLYQIVSPTLPGNGDYSLASMTVHESFNIVFIVLILTSFVLKASLNPSQPTYRAYSYRVHITGVQLLCCFVTAKKFPKKLRLCLSLMLSKIKVNGV